MLRGLAIIQMVFFHFMWDLDYFGLTSANVLSAPWQFFSRGIGTQFAFLLGLSLTLSAARFASPRMDSARSFWKHALIRGGMLFGLGMGITLATYIIIGEQYVRFGILHLLGLALILAIPFVGLRPWISVVVGLGAIGLGMYLNEVAVPFPWLLWLGVPQAGVVMVDYYPLLPWAGVTLLGVATGLIYYPNGQRRFALPSLEALPFVRSLRLLGRHSLAIYLLHQPVLLGILVGLGFGSF